MPNDERPEAGAVAVRIEGVSHRYGRKAALSGVSLSLGAGRMVGLIGPDGVGKSTLLGLVAGVRRIREGRVEVLGGDLGDAATRARLSQRIAYMPQGLGRNLYPTLSVRENIDFHARLFGQAEAERAARIADLLRATGLDPFPDRPAGKLSGGMKQKLSLCCALVHDPDLLILDEPTTGVDPLSRRQFWELIARIRARRPGMSVITATAYMSEAEGFEDLVAMDAGRVLATGTPQELRARTGRDTLEEAFVALLPEESRAGHHAVTLPPRERAEGPPAIEAEGLSMRFGTFTAVDDVSFRIERGEIFGFLGSNGCGKTTTMKMLTGLLAPSEGTAKLFGREVNSGDIAVRRRVGYMSQSFSLYAELTLRQNLALHADLFGIRGAEKAARIEELLEEFDLADVASARPESLPLGVRQRLQLAVAVLHRPEILILDEPTSGVDPVARDGFWQLLIDMSRRDGVTIFISTHFMNEAGRCDRISLMHAGRVLAVGAPEELRREGGHDSLEETFVACLEEATAGGPAEAAPEVPVSDAPAEEARRPLFSPRRVWAFARREGTELMRDPIRLAFALLGPLVLMLAMGFGISFDVENLSYAALDQDRSEESRALLRQFESSRYFSEKAPVDSFAELTGRMVAGDIGFALVIPPDYGRDLVAGRAPEVAAWLDGSMSNRAETARGYIQGAFSAYLTELGTTRSGAAPQLSQVDVVPRFRYNQAFLSVYAIPPGVLMLLLIMIPTMMTALSVVREKELGSIANLYSAPARKIEFLLGKQLPYVAVALLSFLSLVGLMRVAFGLGITGSFAALALGALLYTVAATGFGLVVSTFVRSQIAAVFASAIIVMIPTVNFSGMMYPVSTLEGSARVVGQAFPPLYFQKISAGVFNKGLGLADLWSNHLALAGFCAAFWLLATLLLSKQEA
ncbi:ribosome-associated ATPase/putative transporter RbbA [Oceanicella sp. SM1341]|uniref:ribosome-associated ATPase/putative transporter RbbA n=1 Tax=Oceanicella sp. SM1341 TaxID=1548889 RepID=UPI000E52DAFD|nr:ribosome-associated ATPase/putative transporter RbbA [Oceanicella sp. SM1341]